MSLHPESGQLSAFLDGALTDREHVALEAHLAACADCRDMLRALRATLADLHSLPEETVDEATRWAIRSAIAREARLSGRGRRFAWATGTAAAAVVAILTFALAGGNGDRARTAADTATRREARELDAMQVLTDNFDDQRLSGALKDVTNFRRLSSAFATSGGSAGTGGLGPAEDGAAPAPEPASAQPTPGVPMKSAGTTEAQMTVGDPDLDRARTCLDSIRSERQPSTVIEVIAARYKKEPVFLYFLEAPAARPTRIELWVTTRKECTVRYFQQTRIPPP